MFYSIISLTTRREHSEIKIRGFFLAYKQVSQPSQICKKKKPSVEDYPWNDSEFGVFTGVSTLANSCERLQMSRSCRLCMLMGLGDGPFASGPQCVSPTEAGLC